jgi:hypothetical protein
LSEQGNWIDFIERIFGVSPDGGSGASEAALIISFLVWSASAPKIAQANLFDTDSQHTKQCLADPPPSLASFESHLSDPFAFAAGFLGVSISDAARGVTRLVSFPG